MPQMMPLNWMLLFMFFNLTYFLVNNFIYFSFLINSSKNKLKIKKLNFNWKW
uniref:ATP synthase complex subunit 8 n=1 Tax=Altica brevicollis TaxID=1390103 RepID=A0A1P8NMK1_9CUCU|nr:ATP synthase F0 subunit 8 [Altica brevicollis]